jgi:hypothetical protein
VRGTRSSHLRFGLVLERQKQLYRIDRLVVA